MLQAAVAGGGGVIQSLSGAEIVGQLRKEFDVYRKEAKEIISEFGEGETEEKNIYLY